MAQQDQRLSTPEKLALAGTGTPGESAEGIYEAVMRSGGEPSGAPFEAGLSSLTQRVVKLLGQTGFFGFETLERLRRRNQRNKFTRHGAAPFTGEYGIARRRRG